MSNNFGNGLKFTIKNRVITMNKNNYFKFKTLTI